MEFMFTTDHKTCFDAESRVVFRMGCCEVIVELYRMPNLYRLCTIPCEFPEHNRDIIAHTEI